MDKYENWGTTEKTELYVFILSFKEVYIHHLEFFKHTCTIIKVY